MYSFFIPWITITSLQVFGISIDCPDIINLAAGLNMNVRQPVKMARIILDCCGASTGVVCTSQRVSQIVWPSLNLNGFINASALPSTLTVLDLGINTIKSTYPNGLPNGVNLLILKNNQINGSIVNFPSSLQTIDLTAAGVIGGNLPVLPAGFLTGHFPDNMFTGSIPTPLPSGVATLEIHNNLMSGDLPALPYWLRNLKLGIPGNRNYNVFTGTLLFAQPFQILVNGNWITDVIVTDSSQLTRCDLSNTPLLGNPNIAGLAICTKNNMFDPITMLPDCQTLVIFAKGLNMHLAQPEIMRQLIGNCCIANGITCDTQHVIRIDWQNMGLDGFINGTALPKWTAQLYLKFNNLKGSVPAVWPTTLNKLYLTSNNLTGSIPTGPWPSQLNELSLGDNMLTGEIPTSWPSNLQLLRLFNNSLSGAIPNNLPSTLTVLVLDGNNLSGDLPIFSPALVEITLGNTAGHGNSFTGTLKMTRPTSIQINGNKITDVAISDTSALAKCDLSNNPLLNRPNIADLTMCTQNDLYELLIPTLTYPILTQANPSFPISPSTFIEAHFTSSASAFIDEQLKRFTPKRLSHVLSIYELARMALKIFIQLSVFVIVAARAPFRREFKSKYFKKEKQLDSINI